MALVDPEILERAVRWCADAGRQVTPDEVRRAFAPLSWDELLAVKALLADSPPARPLGPHALADLARGAPADVAAEREREGRYRDEEEAPGPEAPPPPRRRAGRPAAQGKRNRAPVIRRARDRSPPASARPPELPIVDELRLPRGRAVLERLLRRIGARRSALAAGLAAGWRRPDGAPPGEADLSSLLEHHGLLRSFEHRERDELLHALKAAGGVRALAAERLTLDVAAFDAALERLGAAADAARIREERRSELRRRATLSERVRLLLVDERRLSDLGLVEEFERDLRARLPEHLRALRAGPEPLRDALERSLALTRPAVEALAARFALDLGGRRPPSSGRPTSAPRRGSPGGAPGPRTGAPRGTAPRTGGPRGSAGPRKGGPRGSPAPRKATTARRPPGRGRPPAAGKPVRGQAGRPPGRRPPRRGS